MAEISLDKAVNDILSEFSADVSKAAQEAITEVTRESVKKLKQTGPKKSGKYAKGWTSKIEKTAATVDAVIYGKSGTYQLAHLLEHGHAKRGGGRVDGIVHIKPIEERAIAEVETRIREKVER